MGKSSEVCAGKQPLLCSSELSQGGRGGRGEPTWRMIGGSSAQQDRGVIAVSENI